MRRRQHSFNSFLNLDTFVDVFIVLTIIYGVPFLIGYFGCQFLFNGSPEACKDWGYIFMLFTPIVGYLFSRLSHILGIYCDKH